MSCNSRRNAFLCACVVLQCQCPSVRLQGVLQVRNSVETAVAEKMAATTDEAFNFGIYMKERAQLVNEALDKSVPLQYPETINESMRFVSRTSFLRIDSKVMHAAWPGVGTDACLSGVPAGTVAILEHLPSSSPDCLYSSACKAAAHSVSAGVSPAQAMVAHV